MRFLLPLLLLPLVEIAGFAWVGSEIGVLSTIILVLLSAILGVLILQRQGLEALRKAQGRMQAGEAPLRDAFDGLCFALAGILLLIPGFVTDLMALTLFLPPLRTMLYRRLSVLVANGTVHMSASYDPGTGQPRSRTSTVIDADYVEVNRPGQPTDQEELPPPDSRWRPPSA